jgi:hypothetical protein
VLFCYHARGWRSDVLLGTFLCGCGLDRLLGPMQRSGRGQSRRKWLGTDTRANSSGDAGASSSSSLSPGSRLPFAYKLFSRELFQTLFILLLCNNNTAHLRCTNQRYRSSAGLNGLNGTTNGTSIISSSLPARDLL